MENNDYNKNVENFIRWFKVCTVNAIIIGFFGAVLALLTVLKEFTDIEVKASFLYSKVSALIMLVVGLTFIAFEIFCYVKARKYKKLTEKNENNE